MIRVLPDQGLPRSAAPLLRAQEWDAAHVAELGMSQAPDIDILQFAYDHRRTVVTLDADFHALPCEV